jgi:transglutaminase-like putative cysteine protease
MSENREAPAPKITFKNVLPFLIFGILLLTLFLSSGLTKRPPVIESISPAVSTPEEELVIRGRYFGTERNGGFVSVSGITPPSSAYLDWTDKKISLIVPAELAGGLLKVTAENGESREVIPFTNRHLLPAVVRQGPLNPGEPYIDPKAFGPKSGPIGTPISLKGINFGLNRGDSVVLFPWISGGERSGGGQINALPASERDHDYVVWNDREIQVRIPDGASSGNIKVVTDKGQSNAVFFEVQDRIGTKIYGDKLTYHVQYSVEVKDIEAEPDNGLYLWVPRILEVPFQRNVSLIANDPEPMFENYEGLMLYHFENLEPSKRYKANLSFMFDRLSVETKVNSSRVPRRYDVASKLYTTYTASSAVVPASHERITAVSRAVVGGERNPYRKAWRLYDYVIRRLSYEQELEDRDIVAAIDSRKGDAYVYALLFCALARSAGVPSRPISGYLVDSQEQAHRHFWGEFYVEQLGWIPVDPLLGDGNKLGDFPAAGGVKDYYFGNLDNRRITLSRGVVYLKQMSAQGKFVKRKQSASLQTIHEESTGNLSSYVSRWADIEVVGVY